MIKTKMLNNKGLTLIEVVIAMGLTGVLMLSVFSVLSFGTNMYSQGTKESIIQSDLRNVETILKREVKFAENRITVLDHKPSKYDKGDIFLILNENGIAKYEANTSENLNRVFLFGGEDVEYEVVKLEKINSRIDYSIKGVYKDTGFVVESTTELIYPDNIIIGL